MKHIKKMNLNEKYENTKTSKVEKILKIFSYNDIEFISLDTTEDYYLSSIIDTISSREELEDLLFEETNIDSCENYIHIIDDIWDIINSF